MLMGNSSDNTNFVPIGVGETIAGHRIRSAGATRIHSLDYIAYARVTPDQFADLKAYKAGDLTIEELILRLQTFTYVPPANEAEAIERAKAITGQ